ncbi:MAG: hypothetical protein ACRDRW_08065 [Pseudonocardiaceae bacterium]
MQSASFDKTTFVSHAGLGFGAFHHFIYEPFRSGEFTSGSRSQVRYLAEAGMAAAFTAHELRLAKRAAEANPTLCRAVAAPLNDAAASLQRLDNRLSSGQASGSDINQVNTTIDQAQHGSAQAGIPVADHIPSTQQLAHPS